LGPAVVAHAFYCNGVLTPGEYEAAAALRVTTDFELQEMRVVRMFAFL
jgi:hypothetical protein